MIASTHLLVGAAAGVIVAKQTKDKHSFMLLVYALVCGIFFAHFFLDMIPHAEYRMDKMGIQFISIFTFEVFVSLLAILVSSLDIISERKYFIGITAAVFGSALPDLPDILYQVFGLNWWILEKWMVFNSFFHATLNWGTVNIIAQIWIAFLAFSFLIFFNLRYINRIKKKVSRRVDPNRNLLTK